MFTSQESTCLLPDCSRALEQTHSAQTTLLPTAGHVATRRQSPEAIGPYTLLEKVGQGGMGEVYLAEHRLLNQRCAVKVIRAERTADPRFVARFQTEVEAASRVNHPHAVAVLDHGVSADGTQYYSMPWLDGMNLQEVVEHRGPLAAELVVSVLRQVCSALAAAHEAGIVHRDIKPANLMLTTSQGEEVAKVLDFGLAKLAEAGRDDATETAFMGSPLYASPETGINCEQVDGRTDIYALGATAYFLLTGKPVFEHNDPWEAILAHARCTPVAPSAHRAGIPANLEAIVLKCLEKAPADRFQNMQQLDAALAEVSTK